MAFLLIVTGQSAEAITINKKVVNDRGIFSVGGESSLTGSNIKINGKKISKMKKKVKSVKTGYSNYGGDYQKTGYYNASSAYKAGKCKGDGYKYYREDSYTFRFLKPGTYTISYVDYTNRWSGNYGSTVYKMQSSRSEVVNGVEYDYYTLLQINDNDEYVQVGTEEYLKKTIDASEQKTYYDDYTYYEGVTSKKLYASGDDGITQIKFKKGADGYLHMWYEPIVVKTTTQYKYKVVKGGAYNYVTSVQLGKAKYSSAYSSNGYSSTSTYTSKKFLSGNSGKIKVKMGDNYSLTSILVRTYDAEGNYVYQLVKNKGTVTYGNYKNEYSYKSTTSTYGYSSTSLYKPTEVIIYYKNKTTGVGTTIKSVEPRANGGYTITYERTNSNGEVSTYTTSGRPGYNYTSYTFYKK